MRAGCNTAHNPRKHATMENHGNRAPACRPLFYRSPVSLRAAVTTDTVLH